jgi:Bacterial PH domain
MDPLVDTRLASRPYPDSFRLKPSWRSFSGQVLMGLVAAYLVACPADFFRAVGMPADPSVDAVLLIVVRLAALLNAVITFARIAVRYWTHTCVIDLSTLEQREWLVEGVGLVQCVRRIPFATLQWIDVRQTLWETLLNIGTLRVDGQVSGTYQRLSLCDVSSPRRLGTELQHRARACASNAAARTPPATPHSFEHRMPDPLVTDSSANGSRT